MFLCPENGIRGHVLRQGIRYKTVSIFRRGELMKQILSRQAKKHADAAPKPAKKPVVKPTSQAMKPLESSPVVPTPESPPVAQTPVVEKPKKVRFVREQVEKKPEVKQVVPLPPPSKKLRAMLMSKNLALPPKEARLGKKV
ncbi:MAG: hypothetical protein K8U57_01340 [Planctomycetes bacterium]|nr:hypothetical protein [Planctomycetota bacterium]